MPSNRIRIRVDISSDQAIDFVNKLAAPEGDADGDAFRDRLMSSPAEVLWEYGVEASPELLEGMTELPSRHDVQGIRDQIAGGQHVTLGAGPQFLFPVFWMMFPHIGLGSHDPGTTD